MKKVVFPVSILAAAIFSAASLAYGPPVQCHLGAPCPLSIDATGFAQAEFTLKGPYPKPSPNEQVQIGHFSCVYMTTHARYPVSTSIGAGVSLVNGTKPAPLPISTSLGPLPAKFDIVWNESNLGLENVKNVLFDITFFTDASSRGEVDTVTCN